MRSVNWSQQADDLRSDELRGMVGLDEHRPGAARARLLSEQIPVWAVIGHIGAVAGKTDPLAITDEGTAQIASDLDIRLEAVLAALLYYREHREAIDALLEANAAAIA